MPIGAFVPGGLIKASDLNSNYNDIATALTQSLATTGVSTMTGQLNAAAGTVAGPGYTFNGAPKTGFYLAGANQIGWSANGVQGATFNSDLSVTFAGKITSPLGTIPAGTVTDFAGTAAPTGWLLCFGQQVSTTTYAALFGVIGTTYGSGAGTFGIPDCRGRASFGDDNMGGVAAGRITIAGGNFDGTILGNGGGGQNQTLTLGQLPTGITTSGSNSIVVNSTGVGGFTIIPIAATGTGPISQFNASGLGGTGQIPYASNAGTGSTGIWSQTLALTGTNTITATSNNTSGTSHPIMNPAIILNKIIYAGV